jgi:uncharacterized protein (UPF0335 family)
MTFNMQVIDGCLVADFKDIKRTVKSDGLRTKKVRKIMKRWKRIIHESLEAYLKLESSK